MNRLDVEKLRISPRVAATTGRCRPPPRGGRFLKGPVPMPWLEAAAMLPGKALHVGIALWHLAGIQGTAEVQLMSSVLKRLGVQRHSAYRALTRLMHAGLVRVQRRRGATPLVTVLAAADWDGTGASGE